MLPDAWEEEEEQRRRERPKSNGHAAPQKADPRELQLVHFAEIRPRLDGRPLVKNVLELDQTSLIVGAAGCGKTFLALDLALHVPAGMDWFGRRVDEGAVVYVAAEAGRGIFNRVAAFKRAHGYDEDAKIPFATVPSTIDLCHVEAGDVDRLISLIRSAGLGELRLVAVDTISRALAGGNENAPDDMGALVSSLDRIRDELRCHVLAVHHLGKDASKGSRGHTLLHCAVDTEILVELDEQSGARTATITKQRDGETGAIIPFTLCQVELGFNLDGDPVTSCVVEPSDQPAAKGAAPRLSAQQTIALQQLTNAINIDGKVPPSCAHIPPGVRCVDEAVWREYCYRGGITYSDDRKAKEVAFWRCSNALVKANRVGRWEPLVWVVPQ